MQATDTDFVFHPDDFLLRQLVVGQDAEQLQGVGVLAADAVQLGQFVAASVDFGQAAEVLQRLQRSDLVALAIQLLEVFEVFDSCEAL